MTSVMALSVLAGCGSSASSSSEPVEEKEEQAADEAAEAEAEAEEAGPAEGTLSVSDITFPLEEPMTFTVFVNAAATGGGTMQDNYVTAWIEERTNIHLDFVYDLDGDEAKTKLNLLMTDPSSMPDIFLATGWTKSEVQSYGSQGLILPLDEYLADAPNWNELNVLSPARKADLVMPDGHIYTYGNENECFHCMYDNRMWIYMPWVESLNDGHVPETTEELYDFLVKVKTQDPNGNGIADEIPMTGYLGGWCTDPTVWTLNAFLQCDNPISNTTASAGAGLNIYDGKVEYSVMKEEYREALRYMNKLYKEGLLDNQTFTQDNTQFTAVLDNEINLSAVHPGGVCGADAGNFWGRQPGEWQNWAVFEPVAGPEGVRYAARGLNDYFGFAIGMLSANCKNPEIAVALFDFLASKEGTLVQAHGPEGITWNWTNEGTSLAGGTPEFEVMPFPEDFVWADYGYDTEYANSYWPADVMLRCDTAAFRAAQRVSEPEFDSEYILQQAAQKYEVYSPEESTVMPNLLFEGQDAQVISELTLTIGGYVNQAEVQFITGALDLDADWEYYLKKLDEMGVQQYLDIYQKYYDAYAENLNP